MHHASFTTRKTILSEGCLFYRAEERKAALKAAATGMKETGKPEEVFKDSKYAVSEDKSPNVHTRQVGSCCSFACACMVMARLIYTKHLLLLSSH